MAMDSEIELLRKQKEALAEIMRKRINEAINILNACVNEY